MFAESDETYGNRSPPIVGFSVMLKRFQRKIYVAQIVCLTNALINYASFISFQTKYSRVQYALFL